MEILGDLGHVESRFFMLGGSVSVGARLVQDWCMVCARRTIGSEIVLDVLDGTTR